MRGSVLRLMWPACKAPMVGTRPIDRPSRRICLRHVRKSDTVRNTFIGGRLGRRARNSRSLFWKSLVEDVGIQPRLADRFSTWKAERDRHLEAIDQSSGTPKFLWTMCPPEKGRATLFSVEPATPRPKSSPLCRSSILSSSSRLDSPANHVPRSSWCPMAAVSWEGTKFIYRSLLNATPNFASLRKGVQKYSSRGKLRIYRHLLRPKSCAWKSTKAVSLLFSRIPFNRLPIQSIISISHSSCTTTPTCYSLTG